jgi:hypothetical protein
MRAARALMEEETFARGECGARSKVQGGIGLTDLLGFWGQVTWASARRTRLDPGYQITGLQP